MARRRRRSAARRRSPVVIVRSNPAPRRRRRRRASVRSYASNPVRRRRVSRRYRRNPVARRRRAGGLSLPFGKYVVPAVGIGIGALGAQIIAAYLPIPAQFKVGPMRAVANGTVAVVAGMLIGKVLRQKKLGNAIALGGVAIAAYDLGKEFLSRQFPQLTMGQFMPAGGYAGLGYVSPASVLPGPMGLFMEPGMAGASSDGSSVDFRA